MRSVEADPRRMMPTSALRDTTAGREYLLDSGRMTPAVAERRSKKANERTKAFRHEHDPPKYMVKQFIGWDGEGVTVCEHCRGSTERPSPEKVYCPTCEKTVKGDHIYVIFANSEGDSLVNPNGLGTAECVELMLRCAEKNPKAIHVIFAGSYDANMILRPALQPHQALRLGRTGMIVLKKDGLRYRFRYHPRHELSIREELWDDKKGTEVLRKITMWDIFGSFQASFVEACKARLPAEDLAELDRISEMKGNRSTFTLEQIPEVLEYCRAELRALVKLATIDAEDTEASGIIGQSRWDGAGAKVSVLFKNHSVASHRAKTPDIIRYPALCAYAGGRIEEYRFGEYHGPMWTVDIRSAYPWAMTMLPSLKGGGWRRWKESDGISLNDFALFHVRYTADSIKDLHPFHHRTVQGNMLFPCITEGWYWAPEVATALAWAHGTTEVIEGFVFDPATDDRPFDFIPQVFHARQALIKARGKAAGIPLKLTLNSGYGKLAQQLGGSNGKPPPYHQIEWAGWITSRCRAAMFSIAINNVSNLVTIETDGMSFTGHPPTELLNLCGGNIGDLEIEQYHGGTWVQSGIYWLRKGFEWKSPKIRGVGKNPDGSDVLHREDFVAAWDRGEFFLGGVEVDVTRFRGMLLSTTSPKQWSRWCQWVTETREIKVAPHGKREHINADCDRCRSVSGVQLHETMAVGGGGMSAPHRLAWEARGQIGSKTPKWLQEDREEEDDDVVE